MHNKTHYTVFVQQSFILWEVNADVLPLQNTRWHHNVYFLKVTQEILHVIFLRLNIVY